MFSNTTTVRSSLRAWACLVVLTGVMTSAWSQPAQKPLLSRDGGGVKPNIMLTMDDSGSMMFQHMPENKIYVGAYTVNSPVGEKSVRMDPGDNAVLAGFFIGTVAAQRGTNNYRQKLLRSPDTNTIYYNPEVRYWPWALATYPLPAATFSNPAGRMPNSPPDTAYRNPLDRTGGGTVNLTHVRNVDTTWCFRDNTSGCSDKSESYDPSLYYRLKKDGSGNFLDPSKSASYDAYSINGSTFNGDVITGFPKVAARTDCVGVVGLTGCSKTEELQNFANWFTYYRTRNLLARGSLVEAFAESTDTFRIGWGRINDSTSTSIDGYSTTVIQAGVRDFTATTKNNLFEWLYALPASGGTPLPRAMRAVGRYYSSGGNGPWSDNPGSNNTGADKICRRAYHIMVTDGYWNDTTTAVGNSDNTDGLLITGSGREYQYRPVRPYRDGNSNTLADYAMEYWKTDLRTSLDNGVVPSAQDPAFWQHMVNFMVGLGVRGTLQPDKLSGGASNPLSDLTALTNGDKAWGADKIDDLWHAALNSRGEFISAKDPSELAEAIRRSVGQALQRELREAGVATASTILQAGNRKYVPLYNTGTWNGDIQAFVLDADGQAGAQVWNADAKLPAAAIRNIVTWNVDAVPTPAGSLFTATGMGTTNLSNLGTISTLPASTTSDLVNFLRGDRSKEGDAQPFRDRKSALGDFINSNPVLVKDSVNLGYTSLPTGGSTYAAFLAAKAARTATIFVGANDGMLHAFKDTLGVIPDDDGKEIFAFVPSAVLPNLSKLADKTYGSASLYHQYYVDGPLVETDAYVNAPGAGTPSWRNYLVGSLGAGGRSVFALDVTNTANLGPTSVRWEITSAAYPDLGYVTAPVEVGVLPNGEWVVIFGNGGFSSSGKATLFVVNLQTGVAKTMNVGTVGANGLGGVGVVRNSTGQITTLYAGDLKGQVWKFDYLETATSRFELSGGTAFYSASHTDSVAQPITQAPLIFDHTLGGKIVMFATGVLSTETDANSAAVQAIYGVWDKASDSVGRPMDRSLLQARSLTALAGAAGTTFYSLSGVPVNWTGGERGWVVNLDLSPGLRVVYPSQKVSDDAVNGRIALVSVVKPATSAAVCDATTGSGLNLLIPVEQGVNLTYRLFDTDGNGVINDSDALVSGYGTNADGIDAIVRGTPVCTGGICRTVVSIQNTTSQMRAVIQGGGGGGGGTRTVTDRVWRRIINPPIR